MVKYTLPHCMNNACLKSLEESKLGGYEIEDLREQFGYGEYDGTLLLAFLWACGFVFLKFSFLSAWGSMYFFSFRTCARSIHLGVARIVHGLVTINF